MERTNSNNISNIGVIIIGGDHHNTLSVIRSFGRKKIDYKVIIHTKEKEKRNLMIYHSRFGKNLFLVDDNEKSILNCLINIKNVNKQVIISCSDLSQFTIDNNYGLLKEYYLISGYNNKPGLVVSMMNKINQKKWAEERKIPMAKSWNVDIADAHRKVKEIEFPCIIKPNISAFGQKSDIAICNNEIDFDKSIDDFKNKKYKNVIIQKFIKKDYEVCALGAIINNNAKNIGAVIKKDRENPPTGGGSLTFAHFIDDERINEMVYHVITELYKENYRGLYDIEFLVLGNEIYLNEINFRNSGNNYALVKYGIDAPYLYYLNTIDKNTNLNIKIRKRKNYFMDELNELVLLRNGFISFWTFIKEFIKAKSYAKLDVGDLGIVTFMIKKAFRGKK